MEPLQSEFKAQKSDEGGGRAGVKCEGESRSGGCINVHRERICVIYKGIGV